jgi:hypothetical protein
MMFHCLYYKSNILSYKKNKFVNLPDRFDKHDGFAGSILGSSIVKSTP